MSAVSIDSIYAELGLPAAALLVDVRSSEDFSARPRLIPGAIRGAQEQFQDWSATLPQTQRVVVYCSHGEERSRQVASALEQRGISAAILTGGFDAWIVTGLPTIKYRDDLRKSGASRWVTRERPKIDRLACPWLVRRFIDPDASFFYTPAHRVRAEAEHLAAQPFDIADVTFTHRGPNCSFDAFLSEFDLHDPSIDRLAGIVRAADTGELDASREAPGLVAISLGLSANCNDDLILLEQAIPIYDALYAWCKKAHAETHSWPKKALV